MTFPTDSLDTRAALHVVRPTCATPGCPNRPQYPDDFGGKVCGPCYRADRGQHARDGTPMEVPPTPPPAPAPEPAMPPTASASAPSPVPVPPVVPGVGGGASPPRRGGRPSGHPALVADPAAPEERCRIVGCTKRQEARGLCIAAYNLWLRSGKPDGIALPALSKSEIARRGVAASRANAARTPPVVGTPVREACNHRHTDGRDAVEDLGDRGRCALCGDDTFEVNGDASDPDRAPDPRDARIAELERELAAVDANLARIPALDRPTRAENVALAVATAGRAADAEGRATSSERTLTAVRAELVTRRDQYEARVAELEAKLGAAEARVTHAEQAADTERQLLQRATAAEGRAEQAERRLADAAQIAATDLHALRARAESAEAEAARQGRARQELRDGVARAMAYADGAGLTTDEDLVAELRGRLDAPTPDAFADESLEIAHALGVDTSQDYDRVATVRALVEDLERERGSNAVFRQAFRQTHDALDEVGAPRPGSPADRVRALVTRRVASGDADRERAVAAALLETAEALWATLPSEHSEKAHAATFRGLRALLGLHPPPST